MTELVIAAARIKCGICMYYIHAGQRHGRVEGVVACEYCVETNDDFEEVENDRRI